MVGKACERFGVLLLSACVFGDVRGDAFSDHDNGPLAGVFGLPDSLEGASLLRAGERRWGGTLLVASHSVADAGGSELLIIDGETTRLEFLYRRGFGDRLELGVELPLVTHQAGGLDSVIDEWHSAFGLPDGARDGRPRDLLEYAYQDGSELLFDFRQNEAGLGDLRLLGGYRLAQSAERKAALRFGLKLPTGDSDKWLGSGGIDISAGIAVEHDTLWASERWSGFYAAHLTFLGEPEFLADRYEELVWQLAGGVSYQVSPRVALAAQALVRSRLYDADVDSLGEPAFMLTFGGKFRVGRSWELTVGVGEDIKVESVPDVSFQLGLRTVR